MSGIPRWFRAIREHCEETAHGSALHRKSLLTDAWVAFAILIANLLILGPYLRTGFTDQPWNNGYCYMAIARVFRDFHWTWNPLGYGGAPLQYLYPPLFHVLLAAWPAHSLGGAYHLLTAADYALIPVCLYFLGRALFGARVPAAFAAILYSAYPSPAYYLLAPWRDLAVPYAHAPWGFVALVGYEEAPHALGLLFALLSVAAAWRNRWTLAALMTAAVCLTSWPAVLGLGIVMAAVAVAKTRSVGFGKVWLAIFGVVGAGYGLASFWITPGYMRSISLGNRVVLRHVFHAEPWNRTTLIVLAVAAAMLGLALWRRIAPEVAFLLAWVAIAGAIILAFTLAGSALLPMPHRYMLEFNAGLVMAVAGLVWLFRKWHWAPAVAALAILAAGAPAAFGFVSHAWKVQPHDTDPTGSVVYRLAGWLNRHAGHSRILASGEFDPELALWSDVPQAGGPGQGISNYLIFAAERQVAFGCGGDSERIAELWLRALNIRYLVVHGAESSEYFHWFSQPEKFAVLPVAWDDGAGDTIYEAPGFDGQDAVVVSLSAMHKLPRLTSTGDASFLAAYTAWAAGKRPAAIHWNAPGSAVLDAQLGPDEAVLVKINHDRGWRASGETVASDPIGFLLIRGRPGQRRMALEFGASWDVWLGRAITLLTIVLMFVRVPKPWIAALAVVPAMAAYGILAAAPPPTVSVADEAFARLLPPTINPEGIVDAATSQPPPFARGHALSVYGVDFGASKDTVGVWLGGRAAEIVYRSPNMITFKLPPDVAARTDVSVQVNACRGNAFTVETR
jgi:hypothetical protein